MVRYKHIVLGISIEAMFEKQLRHELLVLDSGLKPDVPQTAVDLFLLLALLLMVLLQRALNLAVDARQCVISLLLGSFDLELQFLVGVICT